MKKIIIIALLIISLIPALFAPSIFGDEMPFILRYFWLSTAFLFWVGASAGWNFAMDNGITMGGALVCLLVGIYLSMPIAIFQLFITNEQH